MWVRRLPRGLSVKDRSSRLRQSLHSCGCGLPATARDAISPDGLKQFCAGNQVLGSCGRLAWGLVRDARAERRLCDQELFSPLCWIFAPAFRASLRPMATACLRLFTFPPVPPLPDFNVPSLYSCMTFPTVPMPLVDELVFAVVFLGVLSFALGI